MSEVSAASLQGRIAQRRAQLEQREPIILDIPGYPGLKAKYHHIPFRKAVEIEEKNVGKPTADLVLDIAADKLINACDGIYDTGDHGELDEIKNGDGSTARWNAQTARELFGLSEDELPEGSTARDAVLAIFAGAEEDLTTHAQAWATATQRKAPEINKQLAGESVAAS